MLVGSNAFVFKSSKMDENIKIIVKWSGKEYEISDLTENDTVEKLKDSIYKVTGVRPPRQKLLNLKHKGKWKKNFLVIPHFQMFTFS